MSVFISSPLGEGIVFISVHESSKESSREDPCAQMLRTVGIHLLGNPQPFSCVILWVSSLELSGNTPVSSQ